MSRPKAKRASGSRAAPVKPRRFSLSKKQVIELAGYESLVNHDGLETDPLDPLDIAISAMGAASQDLQVLCHVTDVEAISSSDLGMVLLRLAWRLDAAANIAWENAKFDRTLAAERSTES